MGFKIFLYILYLLQIDLNKVIIIHAYKRSLVFLVSGASYEASYENLFASVLFDSPLSESKVIQNWCKRSLVRSFVQGSTDYKDKAQVPEGMRKSLWVQ